MKKIFRVLVILTLCIFGIAYKKKMCVAILKYYNNLKDNMGMAFTNIFLICIAIFCLIVVFWYIERLIHKKKDYIIVFSNRVYIFISDDIGFFPR